MLSSWLRCNDVSRSASSGSVSVTNESSNDVHGFEKLSSGGAFSRLHCIATELLPVESMTSVCVPNVENVTSVCVSC